MKKEYENGIVEMIFTNPYANLPQMTITQSARKVSQNHLTKKQKKARNKANKAKQARKKNR